jgi:hypothetical protein
MAQHHAAEPDPAQHQARVEHLLYGDLRIRGGVSHRGTISFGAWVGDYFNNAIGDLR